MKEVLITLETAKLAKEKGYDWECNYYSDSDNVTYNRLAAPNSRLKEGSYTFPTQSLLQQWFRERHNLHIVVRSGLNDKLQTLCFKGFDIINMDRYELLRTKHKNYNIYEEGLEEALQEALKLI